MAKSIEEQVEDWCKNQLENYFTKTESINSEIDKALKTAPSKKGGSGQNLPDIKCFVSVGFRNIPVMIECKGTKGDFAKTDENGLISNTNKKEKQIIPPLQNTPLMELFTMQNQFSILLKHIKKQLPLE